VWWRSGLFSLSKSSICAGPQVNGRNIARLKAVNVPYGTIYDIDVDATNKYMITSGQDKRVNIWQVRIGSLPDICVRCDHVDLKASSDTSVPASLYLNNFHSHVYGRLPLEKLYPHGDCHHYRDMLR
jgi:hypothetical protein